MATSLRELIVSVSADTTKYQREMDRASRMGGQYFRSVQQGGADATKAWDRQTSAARTHATAVEASSQAISRYMGVAAGALGVGALIGMADQWTNISARVRLATESSAEYEVVQRRLKDIANATYRSYAEAADQYASTSRIMRELGFSTSDTLDSAEALGLALVAGGADAQKGASALDAWGKSMAQGRIATDQWQTILMQTPRVAQAVADGLGKTTVELTKMAREGQLTAGVVVPAITSQMAKLRGEVAQMPTEFRDAVMRVRNELLTFVGGMNETYDVTGRLVTGLEYLVEHMDVVSKVAGGAAIGVFASKMILMGKATAQAAISAVQSRGAIVAEAVAMRDATLMAQQKAQSDLRRAQAAMTAASGTAASAQQSRNYAAALLIERQATLAATQAEVAMGRALSTTAVAKRAALGLLGGPAGLAITVGAVAAGWLLFRDNSTEATKALRDMTGPLDDVLAKFTELGSAQQMQAMRDAEQAVSDATSKMRGSLASLQVGVSDQFLRPVFEAIDRDVRTGVITVEEGSTRMTAALQRYFSNTYTGEGLRNTLIDHAAAWELNARESRTAQERVDGFKTTQQQVKPVVDATTGSVRGQAGALEILGNTASEAGKKVSAALTSLPGQIERIGKSANQVAGLDVRDWFRDLAGAGLDFNDRDNPAVQKAMQQGAEYVRLQTQLASAQDANARATRSAAAAARAKVKEQTDEEKNAERLLEQYKDLEASQTREIALHGEVGRAAAMAYDTARISLEGFTEKQVTLMETLIASANEGARWLDWLDEMSALEGVWDQIGQESTRKQKDRMDQWSVFADQASRNMQDSLGDGVYSVLDGRFSDVGDSFANMIKRMSSELFASQLWQVIGNGLSGYTGQGGWGNALRGIGGAMTQGAGKAGGGHVRPHSMQDVTEHGPEILQYGGRSVLMMGATGGVVSPLMNKAGGGAGGARGKVEVSIENKGQGMQIESSSAEQRPDGTLLIRLITNTVKQGMSRGEYDGDMSRNFGMKRMGAARG